MRQVSLIFVAFAICLVSCNSGGRKLDSKSTLADSASYYIGVFEARNTSGQLEKMGADDFSNEMFLAGIQAVLAKDSIKIDDQVANALIQRYVTSIRENASKKSLAKNTEFLEKNKKETGVQVTASGLQYKVVSEGSGLMPTPNDTVVVHYKGTTTDGKQFDSSYDRGEPAEFPASGVIPGWVEALQLMKEGGKYVVYIPSDLAYGANGAGEQIPPNSILIFEMELIKVKRAK